MSNYQPPFTLNHAMISKIADIAELLGRWKQANNEKLVPQLRRGNRIRTIQASLAIEQNTLSVEQVTAVLDGKPVLGLPREIQEVRNAFTAYEALPQWNPAVLDDLLAAHSLLLYGLTDDAGQLRQKGVGIYQNQQLVHMAPPPNQLPRLMGDLLAWLKRTDAHPLIASSAFHYELEFIHPFSDGNGRIGRLWQTLMLSHWQPMFAYLPVETVIKSRQEAYYRVLGEADQSADCSDFILFMLDALAEALTQAIDNAAVENTQETALENTQENIIQLLNNEPHLTRHQLAQRLSLTPDSVKHHLQKLKAAGRIEHVGSTKTGYWRVLN